MFKTNGTAAVVATLIAAFTALMAVPSASLGEDKNGLDLGIGVRFNWDNYKKPVQLYDGTDAANALSSQTYGNPHFAGVVNFGVNKQLIINASVDFGMFTHTLFPFPENDSDSVNSVDVKFMNVGILAGAKYLFSEPKPRTVSAYLALGAGKYFAKASGSGAGSEPGDDGSAFNNEQVDAQMDMVSGLASPLVIQLALGADVFVFENFSIGADIFGLRFAWSKANVGRVAGTGPANDDWTGEQSYLNLHIYSALTMNFNLTGGSSSKRSDSSGGWGEDDSSAESTTDQGGWAEPSQGADDSAAQGGWDTGTSSDTQADGNAAADGQGDAGWGTVNTDWGTPQPTPKAGKSKGQKPGKKKKKPASRNIDDEVPPPPAP